jgi:hypothetical protein
VVRAPYSPTTRRAGVVAAAHPLLRLQRAAGNAAVGRLVELQRAPDGMLARGSSGEQVRAYHALTIRPPNILNPEQVAEVAAKISGDGQVKT